MRFYKKNLVIGLMFLCCAVVSVVPLVALAVTGQPGDSSGLVSCGTGVVTATGKFTFCSWKDFLKMINTLITYAIFSFAVPVAVIAIIVAGIKLVLEPTSSNARSLWKNVLWKGVMGLLIALGAYLIVKAVVYGLIGDGSDPYQLKNVIK